MADLNNRTAALARIRDQCLADSVAAARKLHPMDLPDTWPPLPDTRGIDTAGFQRMLQRELDAPDHPLNWHRCALHSPAVRNRAHKMFFAIRENLWHSNEYFALREKARIILDLVIELAREEGFPWYVNVQAREVMRLARLNHCSMAMRLAELECFAITRPARRINLGDDPAGLPRWPRKENNWSVDPDSPLEDIAQWVIRYRRGIPDNANRAAWWLNYDLLCGTGRVLPCFVVSVNTLAKTYENRNRPMGVVPSYATDEGMKAMKRLLAQRGPIPPPGFRAPLWDGV